MRNWPTSSTSNAAFVAQKGIYEYSRARAGHYAKVLFREPEFQAAADVSRWRAYPLGLAMVGELVEGALLCPRGRPIVRRWSIRCARSSLAVFDRYPVPAALGSQTWAKLARRPRPAPQAVGTASAEVGEGHPRAVLGDAIST